jgi:hypothetical protein
MLACARLGAVHTVVFGGFSAESLAQRCADCRSASFRLLQLFYGHLSCVCLNTNRSLVGIICEPAADITC